MKDLTLEELTQIALDAVSNAMEQARKSIIGTGKLGAIENIKAVIKVFNIETSIGEKWLKDAEDLLPEGSYLFIGIDVNTPDGIRFPSIFAYITYLKEKE